jgi:hypothetical protein
VHIIDPLRVLAIIMMGNFQMSKIDYSLSTTFI